VIHRESFAQVAMESMLREGVRAMNLRGGNDWLGRQADAHARRLGLSPAGVRVQDLGFRWGSCGRGDWLYFHWKTILLPRNIAEYVAVHELIHLHEPHHTPEFWRRLERAMPDYDQRKRWLALHGIEVEGV